jgi:hypothetical protein
MKGFGRIAIVALLLSAIAVPAFAWEFSMKGDAEWRYRYWTRTGDNDIFGYQDGSQVYLGINHLKTYPTSNIQNAPGTAPAVTGASGLFGVLAGENCYGKEMSFVDYRVTLYPKIQVNKAVSLEGSLNLTSLGIWSDGAPYKQGTGVANAPAVGWVNSLYVPIGEEQAGVSIPNTYLTMQYLKLGIISPMLNFSIGYKASAWGLGLWKNACNRPSTSFDVSAVYGPLTIGFAPYFARSQTGWGVGGTSRNEGAGSYQRQEQRRNYFLALEGYVNYRSGPLDMGIVSDSYVQQHSNRVTGRLASLTGAGVTTRPDQDDVRYRIDTYAKYFNGRFFADAEFAWFTRWRGGRGSADPSSAATAATLRVQPDQDANAFLYALETGMVCGPSKVTLNYVRATGQDPSSRYDGEDAGSSEQATSACYMKDWGLLMYYMYGTGTGWDAAGDGQPTDFVHLGGKLDYAVASNLNLFGLVSYAWRDNPAAWTLGGDWRGAVRPFTNNDIAAFKGLGWAGAYSGQTSIPNSAADIGWEVDAGFSWKLLENLVWKSTFAYWQPGSWWSYAYPNTANIYRFAGGTVPGTAGTLAGADRQDAIAGAGRSIDPLFAVESNLLINF